MAIVVLVVVPYFSASVLVKESRFVGNGIVVIDNSEIVVLIEEVEKLIAKSLIADSRLSIGVEYHPIARIVLHLQVHGSNGCECPSE